MSDYKKLSPEIFNAEQDNLERLAAVFPEAVKDGAVDFDALREELGQFEEVTAEKYELTWAGKQNAKKAAQTDVAGRTLKYVPEDSKDADTTQNLYIEGDNLEVLKLLRQNYYGAVKMIYIDPPYNTGNDFIYRDNFAMSKEKSDEAEGYLLMSSDGYLLMDSEGHFLTSKPEVERLVANQKSGNRYHANWLNMIYPRIRIAKDLLADDGVIFISIDDNEIDNMKKVCNEVFSEFNFVACLVWEKKKKGSFLSNDITNIKEYILVYSKQKLSFPGLIGEINSDEETYPCVNASNKRELRIIPAGIPSKYKEPNYTLAKDSIISDTTMSLVLHSDLVIENGVLAKELKIEGNWRYSQEAMTGYALNNEIYVTRDLYLRRIVKDARYKTLKDLLPREGDETATGAVNIDNLFASGWGSNEDADEEQRLLFGAQKVMDYPKPVQLLYKLIASYRQKDFIIMDFFSGSATTAHAAMQLNTDDGGTRQIIMVQFPEDLDRALSVASDENTRKSVQASIDYLDSIEKPHTIVEIGKERIRRAGEKIKTEVENENTQLKLGEEPKQVPDIGFKVFRGADTNIRWTHDAIKGGQMNLDESLLSDKEKLDFMPGFTDIDVVYEVLLRQRDIPLSSKVEKLGIGDRTYLFADAYVVCLDENVTKAMVEELAAVEPTPIKYVFRDSAFNDDISLKDKTVRRLEAYIARNNGENKKAYTVEFI